MNTYAIYSSIDGRIITIHSGNDDTAAMQASNGLLFTKASESVNINTHYVNLFNSKVTAKTDYELKSLPLPCTVTIEGVKYTCEEQPVFSFDIPGKYVVSVDAGPAFLKKEFTIDYKP